MAVPSIIRAFCPRWRSRGHGYACWPHMCSFSLTPPLVKDKTALSLSLFHHLAASSEGCVKDGREAGDVQSGCIWRRRPSALSPAAVGGGNTAARAKTETGRCPPSALRLDLTVCRLTHTPVHSHVSTHTRQASSGCSQVTAGPRPVLMQSFLGILPPNCLVYFFQVDFQWLCVLKASPRWALMHWTGREWDDGTRRPPPKGRIHSCTVSEERNITAFS